MSTRVEKPGDEEKKLAERAAASGKDVTTYVRQLIRRDIDQPSFAELLAPIHQAVRDSGVTDSELDSLIESAVADARQQRRAKNTK